MTLQPLLFVHLPKTGGTTLREWLLAVYGPLLSQHISGDALSLQASARLWIWHDFYAEGGADSPAHGLVLDWLDAHAPGARILTVVRDPFDRAVSHYHHLVRNAPAGWGRPSLADWLFGGLPHPAGAHRRYYAGRMAAWRGRLEIAGVTEALDLAAQAMAAVCGAPKPPALPRSNAFDYAAAPQWMREAHEQMEPMEHMLYRAARDRALRLTRERCAACGRSFAAGTPAADAHTACGWDTAGQPDPYLCGPITADGPETRER